MNTDQTTTPRHPGVGHGAIPVRPRRPVGPILAIALVVAGLLACVLAAVSLRNPTLEPVPLRITPVTAQPSQR